MRLAWRAARRLAALGLTAMLAASLSGCWSKQELNDRTFVSTLVVDRSEDGQTEVTALFILPNRVSSGLNASQSRQKPYAGVSGKGRNVAEAFQRIQRDLPRSATWGQLQLVIVGDSFARHTMAPLFDFLIRATDFRLSLYLFYFNGDAKELTELTPMFERFPSEIWRETAHTKQLPPVRIRDLLYSNWNNLGDGFIPELTIRRTKLPTEAQPLLWSGTGGAAMMKDGKVVDTFSSDETEGILLLRNHDSGRIVTGELPDGAGLFSVKLIDVNNRTTATRRGRNVRIHVAIHAQADLLSIQSGLDLTKTENIRKIEAALDKRLGQLAQSAADKAMAEDADVFQWSEFVRYKYPSLWRQWSAAENARTKLFASLEPVIAVHSTLRNTGLSHSAKP